MKTRRRESREFQPLGFSKGRGSFKNTVWLCLFKKVAEVSL